MVKNFDKTKWTMDTYGTVTAMGDIKLNNMKTKLQKRKKILQNTYGTAEGSYGFWNPKMLLSRRFDGIVFEIDNVTNRYIQGTIYAMEDGYMTDIQPIKSKAKKSKKVEYKGNTYILDYKQGELYHDLYIPKGFDTRMTFSTENVIFQRCDNFENIAILNIDYIENKEKKRGYYKYNDNSLYNYNECDSDYDEGNDEYEVIITIKKKGSI